MIFNYHYSAIPNDRLRTFFISSWKIVSVNVLYFDAIECIRSRKTNGTQMNPNGRSNDKITVLLCMVDLQPVHRLNFILCRFIRLYEFQPEFNFASVGSAWILSKMIIIIQTSSQFVGASHCWNENNELYES